MPNDRPGFWMRVAYKAQSRFRRVWGDKYPRYWHLIDAFIGLVAAFVFVFVYDTSAPDWTRALWFFAAWILGYLMALAATYGVVRARNFGPKRK